MFLFSRGESVCKEQFESPDWLPGSVVKQTGPVSCKVTLQNGRTIHWHPDQFTKRDIDDLVMTKELPLLTDDNLTMFTGNNITPEITNELLVSF